MQNYPVRNGNTLGPYCMMQKRNTASMKTFYMAYGIFVMSLVMAPIAGAILAPWTAISGRNQTSPPSVPIESVLNDINKSKTIKVTENDLARIYPTTLIEGDTQPNRAREWQFHQDDIYALESFTFKVGPTFKIECKDADLGVGHCEDGAVWAVVIPKDIGMLQSKINANPEEITHIWLRFHPQKLAALFPPKTVVGRGNTNQYTFIRRIAAAKITSSWHAGERAMIPSPNDMTVDAETVVPVRRFFAVNLLKETTDYFGAFEKRTMKTAKAVTASEAESVLEEMWTAFDKQYAMFVLRPEVNWNQLKKEFYPKVQKCKTNVELAATLAEMLKNLRDLHVWMTVNGENVPVYNRPRKANANPNALKTIFGKTERFDSNIEWTVTTNHIGYIAIYGWNNPSQADQLDEVLENMRNTRGMIIDVRLNGGGSEPVAQKFAARFLSKEFVYSYSQYRNGPKHTDLTTKNPRKVIPEGPWRYDRPVILLIGEKCMSSNESFVAMMEGDDQVVTFGSRTCGSSGNPTIVKLPCDITVSVPRWIDYLADGTPLDEHGIKPKIAFNADDEAFAGNRDDVLEAAIAMMQGHPLPSDPIKGSPRESGDINSKAPKTVSVFPQQNANNVLRQQEIRIRFDQPMKPKNMHLEWQSGGFLLNGMPRYDVEQNEFFVPVFLEPGIQHKVAVNYDPFSQYQSRRRTPSPAIPAQRDGFGGTDGNIAKEYRWEFNTAPIERKADATPLRVVSVTPAAGETTSILTLLDITFDQPLMQPMPIRPYLVQASRMEIDYRAALPSYTVNSNADRIVLPLILNSNQESELEIEGFWSVKGVKSDPIKVGLKTDGNHYSGRQLEEFAKASRDPSLESLLSNIHTARRNIFSLTEKVQFVMLFGSKGVYTRLSSCEAIFKFQGTNQFYGDITGPMSSIDTFLLGSDGQHCWLYSVYDGKKKLIKYPSKEVQKQMINIADPFELTTLTTQSAISQMHLIYLGKEMHEGSECHKVQGWQVKPFAKSWSGSMYEWWIDSKSFLPKQLLVYSNFGCQIFRYNFEQINQEQPLSSFQPPKGKDIVEEGYKKEPGCENAFFQLGDGANGHITGRLGLFGDKKRISSGLN